MSSRRDLIARAKRETCAVAARLAEETPAGSDTDKMLAHLRSQIMALRAIEEELIRAKIDDGETAVIHPTIPIVCLPSDPDRLVKMIRTAGDRYSLISAARALKADRQTIRDVDEMFWRDFDKIVRRSLGPHYEPPPPNPLRKPQKGRRM